MGKKGKQLLSQSREIIHNVYKYFLSEANQFKKHEDVNVSEHAHPAHQPAEIGERLGARLVGGRDHGFVFDPPARADQATFGNLRRTSSVWSSSTVRGEKRHSSPQ